MATIIKNLGPVTAYGYAKEQGYAGTEEEYAELMASYATVAEEAAESAAAAAQSATEAATSETNAGASATAAAGSASSASSSAGTATTKAAEAGQSATAAAGSASTASSKATEAAQSASSAAGSATDAVAAKQAAQAAQGAAETAQAAAEAAAEQAEQTLESYAKVDGSYDSMTVGVAQNLESSEQIEDKVPYTFRPVPDGAGNRETDTIIGGTVAWNQLAKNGDFDGTNNWAGATQVSTIAANDNVLEVNAKQATDNTYVDQLNLSFNQGHKYFISFNIKTESPTNTKYFYFGTYPTALPVYQGGPNSTSAEWKYIKTILNCTSTSVSRIRVGERDTAPSGVWTYYLRDIMVLDLTQMFGSTIADYIYSLETANVGAGVAWFRKLFPKSYYAYNAGELLSVSGLQSHDMVGFNQWDEEWELGGIANSSGSPYSTNDRIRTKNYIPVIPGLTYYKKCPSGSVWNNKYYDVNKNYIGYESTNYNSTFIIPKNAYYMKFSCEPTYGTTYNHDICINLSWDGERNGEYEPYKKWSYPLDSSLTLRGVPKLDANNDLYYDGDVYESDGTVTRKYRIVDLGTLNWNLNNHAALGDYFYADVYSLRIKRAGDFSSTVFPSVCSKYNVTKRLASVFVDKTFCFDGSALGVTQIQVKDSSYSDAATFKTAMSGVYLVYELATPTTETADPFANPQSCAPGGTEEYVDAGVAAGTREVSIPVGHDTLYNLNLTGKLENLPSDFSTLIAPTEKGLTATRAYSVKQFLIVKNQLYKVTASIANGGTITPGTNVTATTICEVLTSLL